MDSENLPNSQQSKSSVPTSNVIKPSRTDHLQHSQWEDVTNHFRQAQTHMSTGEMIHTNNFDLHTAMSAIELMDPKMDIGFGTVREVGDIKLPTELTGHQVINIMDQLLACEMSWLDSHTLPQTVFSCAYTQRLAEVPRIDLFSFIRIQLSTMYHIINLIQEERVSDEEDIIPWTYGFRLRPTGITTTEQYEQMSEQIIPEVETEALKYEQDDNTTSAIITRIQFQIRFNELIRLLKRSSMVRFPDKIETLLQEMQQLAEAWKESVKDFEIDKDLIDLLFDSSMNRHLMMSSPPRTAALFKLDEAFQYLLRITKEFQGLMQLRSIALPGPRKDPKDPENPQNLQASLQVAFHAVQYFFAEYTPTSLTRSVMSRVMISKPWNGIFHVSHASHVNLLTTDMGLSFHEVSQEIETELDQALHSVISLFKCFCTNRSRQRQYVLQVMKLWDQFCDVPPPATVVIDEGSTPDTGIPDQSQTTNLAQNGNQKEHLSTNSDDREADPSELLENKSPIQLIAYEVMGRLMIYHWLLGFECDLYQEYEYAAVYFYVGYVLISLTRATTALASNARQQGSTVHPVRFALCIMDDACIWMCRALQSTLEALSESPLWDYSCERPGMQKPGLSAFGSERLWYNQRFGVVSSVVNGPPYADYDSYLSFRKLVTESLSADDNEADLVHLRLKEAASAFTLTRKKLERVRRVTQNSPENFVTKEALALARVAIENSLAITQILRITTTPQSSSELGQKYKVDFNFSKHRHFPVLKISNAL